MEESPDKSKKVPENDFPEAFPRCFWGPMAEEMLKIIQIPVVQMTLQTEKNIFELIMHFIADTDTDENSFGNKFS